jgi:hypothetical protein
MTTAPSDGERALMPTQLSMAARAFRLGHALIAAVFLAAIGYVWWCGVTGRRGRLLQLAIGSLACEGVLVAANHGDCPLGQLQTDLGDPVPLFELVLPPRAARMAVPALGGITAAGVAVVFLRRNGQPVSLIGPTHRTTARL